MKKRIFIILLLFLLIWTVSGCGRTFWVNYLFASDDKEFSEILEDFLQAADKNDKKAIQSLFANNVTKNRDFNKKLDDFLDFYSKTAKNSSFDVDSVLTGTRGTADKSYWCLDADVELTKDDKTYYIYMQVVTEDKNDPQNIGIQIMDLATKQAFDDRYFLWHSESGIYKQEIACEDYRCMIISGNRREYEAVDRELSADYFRDFIQKSTDYGELLNEIGKPNGELLKDEYVFEITQRADEKMYAVLSVSGNEIMRLEIANEKNVIDKIYERNAK